MADNNDRISYDGIEGIPEDENWVAWGHADTKTRTTSSKKHHHHHSGSSHRGGSGYRSSNRHHSRRSHKRHRGLKITIIVIVAVIAVYAGCLGYAAYGVAQDGRALLSQMSTMQTSLTNGDKATLDQQTASMQTSAENIKNTVDGPLWSFSCHLPLIGTDLTNVQVLGDTAYDLVNDALVPLATEAGELGGTNTLVSNGTINVELISQLVPVLQQVEPVLEESSSKLDSLDSGSISQVNSAVSSARKQIDSLAAVVEQANVLAPYLPAMLGADGERSYLILAHNTSELKPSGGFIGSVGVVTINNGEMEIGDFSSFWDCLPTRTGRATVTDEEDALFTDTYGVNPGDSGVNPNFVREGEMSKELYDSAKGTDLDGVIAVDSQVLADMLDIVGGITTSDGTQVTGDNVVQLLGHDLYWHYFAELSVSDQTTSSDACDEYFAEVASLAFDKMFSNLNGNTLRSLFSALDEDASEYRFQVWMSDTDEEQAISEMGYSGEISHDETQPVLGVFVENRMSSKLDWWNLMNTKTALYSTNSDGSKTYTVTTTIRNTITQTEVDESNTYINGGAGGTLVENIYLYAPAGGSISDVSSSGNLTQEGTYEIDGMDVTKVSVNVSANGSMTITYKVTTSSNAQSDLQVRSTPMAQTA